MMKYLLIGVDPGRKTGIAIWNRAKKKYESLETTDFWGAANRILELNKKHEKMIQVVIENPGLNKPTFALPHEKEKIDTGIIKRDYTAVYSQMRMISKRSQDIGRNKENAYLLIELCRYRKIDCKEVRPVQKKWNAETFKRLTGYKERTNEHNRDAARLVFQL